MSQRWRGGISSRCAPHQCSPSARPGPSSLLMVREASSHPGTCPFSSTGLDHSLHMVCRVSALIQSSNAGRVVVASSSSSKYDLRSAMAHRFCSILFFFFPVPHPHRQNSWPSTPSSKGLPRKNLQFSRAPKTSLMTSAVSHGPTPAKIERSPHLVAHQRQSPQEMSQPERIVRDSVETAVASEKLASPAPNGPLPASSQHENVSGLSRAFALPNGRPHVTKEAPEVSHVWVVVVVCPPACRSSFSEPV